MIDDVKRAYRKNAVGLIEVAKAALSRIEIASLEPDQRVDLRTADELLTRSLEPIQAELDQGKPGSDVR